MPIKNIWVFGGTGFIGKALLQHLSNNREYRLNVLIHKNVPYRELESYNTFCSSLEEFDFEWFKRYPPHYIFHMARLGSSNSMGRYIASRKGAKANQGLINFLCTLPHKPVITYVSGSLMYGNQVNGEVATEHSPLNPTSYAKHYIFAEQPWLEAQKNTDLDIRFARPGWIVGAESWFRFFYWLPYCQSGKVPLYGTGNQLMSLVHLTDCAGQIVNLAFNGTKGQNMNIYSGLPVTQSYFSMLLAKLLYADVEPIPESVLVKNYGKTVCEALLSSIPIQTLHSNIYNQYNNMYTTSEDILRETLLSLKNK